MAKGKTQKPLTIVVHSALWNLPEIVALRSKGHAVSEMTGVTGEQISEADMVLGPSCWRMTADLTKYIEAAVKGARLAVYGSPKKKGQADDSEGS